MKGDLRAAWLTTRLAIRWCGRTVDLDELPGDRFEEGIAPIQLPVCVVTAWNPNGKFASTGDNRAANHRLRDDLDRGGRIWLPAVGRAADKTWREPGFAVGACNEMAAVDLGIAWRQLAVFWVTRDEVAVLPSDRSFRDARRRGTSMAPSIGLSYARTLAFEPD